LGAWIWSRTVTSLKSPLLRDAAGTLMLKGTGDRVDLPGPRVAHLKDELMLRYASLHLQRLLWTGAEVPSDLITPQSGERRVRLKLYKASASSGDSKADSSSIGIATFETTGAYNQADASGSSA